MTPALREAFLEHPEYAIALMFSAADQRDNPIQTVIIDFMEGDVRATVQRPDREPPAPRLLASKDTIYTAIVLHQLLIDRGPDFAESLVDRASRFGRFAAKRPPEFVPYLDRSEEIKRRPEHMDTVSFFNELEVPPRTLEEAVRKTRDALAFLEQEGLAVDPAFVPGLVVLSGLIPLHFSIRTPKGQRIYKEICVDAPWWSLKISRGRHSDAPFTDVDFRFRGVEMVKRAITAMATQYLESEEEGRRRNGQPVIRRSRPPELDGD